MFRYPYRRALSLFCIIIGTSAINAMKPTLKWLILGAGTQYDTAEWNKYAQKRSIDWMGFNNEPCIKCIKGDFNKADNLETKLEDGTYDTILFDDATAHYSDWGLKHLKALHKKLKDGGSLYIIHSFTSGEVKPEKPASYTEYKNRWNEFITPQTFINGEIFLDFEVLDRAIQDTYYRRYLKEVLHPHNMALLRSVFGNNVQLRINTTYPDAKGDRPETYYVAIKSDKDIIKKGQAIVKQEYKSTVGDYTIKGRLIFPPQEDKMDYMAFFDKDKNVYIVQYPGWSSPLRNTLEFLNTSLGTNFTRLYSSFENKYIDLDDLPSTLGPSFGLDGPYGEDINFLENASIDIFDIPLIKPDKP